MKCFKLCVLCSILICLSLTPAQSDLYEYIDENGVRSYTDDSSMMSMPQRHAAKALPEVVSRQPNPAPMEHPPQKSVFKPGEARAKVRQAAAKENIPGRAPDHAALATEANVLKQMKSDLDREYSRLQSEKQRLTNLRDELRVADTVNVATMENFRSQVNTLNRETAVYEEKLMTFMGRVSQYNKKIQ